MPDKKAVVTIDGPSGSGKSTISKLLASRLHYTYLDTGAMYRVVGLQVKRAGLDLDQETGRARLPELLADIDLRLAPPADKGGETRAFLGGEDVSDLIRTPEMSMVASRVSAEPAIREKLTEMQRKMGREGGVVAEGRDTGTVVFPGAEYKFFLDASPEERTRRRCEQLRERGQDVDFQEILEQIRKRDKDDSSRSLAPLTAAGDAIIIDSSAIGINEVVDFMMSRIRPSR